MMRGATFEPMMWQRGNMKFIVLMMLQDHPQHGYALMKAVEEKYERPIGQGIIYPTLQMLEDQSYVSMSEQEHKKVYSITEEGERYLKENDEVVRKIRSRLEEPRWKSLPSTRKHFHDLAMLIFSNYGDIDEDKMKKIDEILEDARKRIGRVIFEG